MVDDLTKTIIVHGKYVFTNFEEEDGGVIKNGAVVIQNETIIATGLFKLLREEYPDAVIVGTDKDYVLPGIIDAHSHGQGLSYVQRGFAYDYLENCLFDWKRSCNLSDELNAKLTALKHLRNGGTMVHVNQYIENPSAFSIDRIKAIIDTYRKCGIRFAYSPGMKDINRLSNNDEELYDYLPVKLQSFAKPMFFPDQNELIDNYETLFRQLRAEIHDDLSCILQGPYWAHGLSDLFLERIAQLETDYNDTPVHIHTLQTPYQRKYGEKNMVRVFYFI